MSILLPRVDEMARGHVIADSHDANGNIMTRAHTNLLLDTMIYQVEFTGGKVAELTTNIIAQSMYALCYEEGKKYILLNMLVDYCEDNKVIFVIDNQTVYGADQ